MVLNIINGKVGNREMSYSTTICRTCNKNTWVNLESSNYLCADCLKKANRPRPNKQSDDLVVKKNVRWLQAWLTIDNLETTKIVVSWLKPEFTSKYNPKIDNYYVYSKCGRIQEIVSGKFTQVICNDIERDSNYEISVNALIKETPINAQLNKSFYNR